MSASFDIRDAVAADAEGIAAIYNHAVLHTTAIWIDTPVDVANRAAWLAGVQRQGYPVLVAADAAGAVLGSAAFADWRPLDGDSHTVEHSIYIRHDARGRGVGLLPQVGMKSGHWRNLAFLQLTLDERKTPEG